MNVMTVKRIITGGSLGLAIVAGIVSSGPGLSGAAASSGEPLSGPFIIEGYGCELPAFDPEGGTLSSFRNPSDDAAVAVE